MVEKAIRGCAALLVAILFSGSSLLAATPTAKTRYKVSEQKLNRLSFNLGQMLFGRAVARESANLIGQPYKWGGVDPKSGFDCSGLTRYVFRKLGADIPRTALLQFAGGISIEKPALAPGDLVFFATGGPSALHVGVYIGDNSFIHSPGRSKKIQRALMDKGYWKTRFHGGRRYLPDQKPKPKKEKSAK